MSELENQADEQLQDEYYEEDYSEEYQEEVEEVSEEEPQEEVSELAPDSEPEHEENTEDGEPQMSERAQEVINMKHRKMKEAQEENERLRQQLEQFHSQQSYSQAPTIPEIPDAFDDDYDSKMRQRDEAIMRYQQWQAEQNAIQQRQQQRELARQQEEARKLQESSRSYMEKAKKAGIKPEALQQSAQVVAQYLDNNNPNHMELTRRVLADENGPLITQYLASHSLELSDIAEMNPIDAVLHIEKKIKPKLQGFNRKSNAPKPKRRAGGAAPKPDSGLLKGATFE